MCSLTLRAGGPIPLFGERLRGEEVSGGKRVRRRPSDERWSVERRGASGPRDGAGQVLK